MKQPLVFLFVTLIMASCGGNTPSTTTTSSTPAKTGPKATKGTLTSKAQSQLESLIALAKKQGNSFDGKKLFQTYGLEAETPCQVKGKVRVYTVKGPGGKVRAAMLYVTPKGFDLCDSAKTEIPPAICTVSIGPKGVKEEKLVYSMFMGGASLGFNLRVKQLGGFKGYTILRIAYESVMTDSGRGCEKHKALMETSKSTGRTEEKHMYYSLVKGAFIELGSIDVGARTLTSYNTSETKGTVKWHTLASRSDPILSLVSYYSSSSKPMDSGQDAGEGLRPSMGPMVDCSIETKLYALVNGGKKLSEVTGAGLTTLLREPELKNLPAKKAGSSADQCDAMNPENAGQ
ncbi:hypothetical protein KKF84_00475 [Myxococcota bacterium]|nr:hypothetical protein [Myxococcota bacterium]MBU1533759.1 hypothetical protein [Myxococcota bacterium]